MLKLAGLVLVLITLLELGCCREHLKPEPPELARYQTLKPKRLLYEKFKETKLVTVPGYGAKETDDDDSEPPFVPSLECGDEFLNLTKGTFGTITSPNYPRRYLPDLQCEWILESVPGTVIEVTLFDSVTQPWLFTFYDYIKISLTGEWDKFQRFAGDVNYKTPYTLVSEGNRLVVRFVSSAWLNFRGFSMFYIVRNRSKADTNPQTNEFGSVYNQNVVAVCNRKPEPPPRPNDKYSDPANAVKIINGEVTVPHQYPFTVALLIDGQYFCSGTLIDDVNVVTAAHCVDGVDRIVLIFGLHNMTNPAERYYSRQIRLVEFPDTANHVFVHPHFNPDTGHNDIAIVRVAQKVRFTGYVQPIYLPSIFSAANTFYGKNLKTVGWGQYDTESDGISTVLREGRARVISNADCREEFRGAITGNNICTLTPYKRPENNSSAPPPPRRRFLRQSEAVTSEGPEQVPSETTEHPVSESPEPVPSESPAEQTTSAIAEQTTSETDTEEGAAEIEPQPQPEFISPCYGDAGGPLFTEFKESSEGSKDSPRQECVDAKPNGSNDDDLKKNPTCDVPKQETKKWFVLVGVVSFGTSVCGDEIPVAYSRVAAHLEWIAYVTGRHG